MTDRVIELLEEYASCYNKLDPYKVAAEIREAVETEHKPALIIAENMYNYWIEKADGAEK